MELMILTIVGVIVLIALVWFLTRKLGQDHWEALLKKRADGARVSLLAEYIEGRQQVPVAMTLSDTTLYYENDDLQASLDLSRIDEVEYGDSLSTARPIEGKVLLLRSHGQTFEFILDEKKAEEMQAHLPPHRMDEPGDVHAV